MKLKAKINKKHPRRVRHPYIKNSVSCRCEFYPSSDASNPSASSTFSNSFNVKLLPAMIAVVTVFGAFCISVMKKFRNS